MQTGSGGLVLPEVPHHLLRPYHVQLQVFPHRTNAGIRQPASSSSISYYISVICEFLQVRQLSAVLKVRRLGGEEEGGPHSSLRGSDLTDQMFRHKVL